MAENNMKITKSYLKQIIKEELNYVRLEQQDELNEINLKSMLAPFLALALTAAPATAFAKTSKKAETSDQASNKRSKDPQVLEMATDTLRASAAIGPLDVVIEIIDISTPRRQGVGYNIKASNGQDYGVTRMGPINQ